MWRLSAGILALFAILALSQGRSLATNLAAMSPEDIKSLQQRLFDAKCYRGPIDGVNSVASVAAVRACPVMDPILSIETGMHTGPIRRVEADRDCKLLATGSDDKTVHLWSLPDVRLIHPAGLSAA